MKHLDRVNMSAKYMSLTKDFSIPDYSPSEYQCPKHGGKLKLIRGRVLYCRKYRHGFLHPRYNFNKDCIV